VVVDKGTRAGHSLVGYVGLFLFGVISDYCNVVHMVAVVEEEERYWGMDMSKGWSNSVAVVRKTDLRS